MAAVRGGSDSVRVRAHAKINLGLQVGGARPDGYHELVTIFQTVALHDCLTVRRASRGLELRSSFPGLPLDDTNIVWRAAELLWAGLGREGVPDVLIEIDKHIPTEAGLGGGSTDAAGALVALEELWDARLDPAARLELAEQLGADVPFFLLGGTAVGRGRGGDLEALPSLPTHGVVLVKPSFGVSTRDAYAWYDDDGRPPPSPPTVPRSEDEWPDVLPSLANALEPVVARRHPEIGELVAGLRAQGAVLAAMSGSGSAAFGLFPRSEDAERAARAMVLPGRQVVVTATIDRDAYRRSAAPERGPA